MKKKIVISFIGNSIKFIKIFKSIYPYAILNFYSWRFLSTIIFEKKDKPKSDMVVICGYDYSSQWYQYQKYYDHNVVYPLKFAKSISKKNAKIIYIDTINKISKNKKKQKKYTFSRYEFAKKELRKVLLKNFKSVKILTLPVLVDNKKKADVHGNIFTKVIYNFLITLNYTKTINPKKLKKKIIDNLYSNKNSKVVNLNPILLGIPRSLFFDRILRLLND
tara:strand:- start:2201 stop:2860 length:660 start_codon:yes stop_codon:yes gene_type:complete